MGESLPLILLPTRSSSFGCCAFLSSVLTLVGVVALFVFLSPASCVGFDALAPCGVVMIQALMPFDIPAVALLWGEGRASDSILTSPVRDSVGRDVLLRGDLLMVLAEGDDLVVEPVFIRIEGVEGPFFCHEAVFLNVEVDCSACDATF